MAVQVIPFHKHIVIAKDDELTVGLPRSVVSRRCGARPMLAHQLDLMPFCPSRVYGDLGRVISTGVIHDDNLYAAGGIVDCEEAVER